MVPRIIEDRRNLFTNYELATTPQREANNNTAFHTRQTDLNKSPQDLWPGNVVLSSDQQRMIWRSFLLGVPSDDQQTLSALSRWKPWRGQWDPQNYTYGTFYLATVGAWTAIPLALGLIDRNLSLENLLQAPDTVAQLYASLRRFSAVCNLVAAIILVLLAKQALHLSTPWALVTGLLYLASPLTDAMSHLAKPHALGALLILAGSWAVATGRSIFLTGLCWGLASASLITNTFFLPALLWLEKDKKIAWLALGLALLVLFALNPFLLLTPSAWWAKVELHHISAYHQGRLNLYETGVFLRDYATHGFFFLLWPFSLFGILKLKKEQLSLYRIGWVSLIYFVFGALFFRHGGLALGPTALFILFSGYGAKQWRLALPCFLAILITMGVNRWWAKDQYAQEGNNMKAAEWINIQAEKGDIVGFWTPALTSETVPPIEIDRFPIMRYDHKLPAPRQMPKWLLEVSDRPIESSGPDFYTLQTSWESKIRGINPFFRSHENRTVRIWKIR